MNDYFQDDGNPGYRGSLASAPIRTLFANIEAAWDKVVGLTGNGGKIVAINAGGTAQEALSTTGTGNVVRATSPTLVTPLLGTPTSGTLTNCTGLVPETGLSSVTGTGAAVLATSPTLVTPNLGTPTALVGTNITGTAENLTAGNAGTSGTFTITGTGFTTVMTATATWYLNNNVVHLTLPYGFPTGTSNATTFTLTGLPAGIQPASQKVTGNLWATDNGTTTVAIAFIGGGTPVGVISLWLTTGVAWTTSGQKWLGTTEISYSLN